MWDEEKVKKNDLIGEAIFHYEKVTRGECKQAPIEIMFKNKYAGTVYVEFDFKTRMGQNIGNSLISKMKIGGVSL